MPYGLNLYQIKETKPLVLTFLKIKNEYKFSDASIKQSIFFLNASI